MLKKTLAGLGAALLMSVVPVTGYATELVVYHGWSSPAEVAALNVLKAGLEAKGHTWTDLAIPHDSGASVSLINLVTGGNPPNVFMEADPGFYRDLATQGLDFDLTQWFTDNHVTENLASSVVKSITVDGKIVKVPTALHIDGMVYYNMDVAKQAGVDPAAWTSLDAMFADFDKIKAAGFIPLAIGGQQWQVGYLTHTLAAAVGGAELYNGLYSETPDKAVLDSPAMHDLLTWIRRWQQAADEGSPNRDWNVTTNMVITGKALMQIHGDWMKGEWRAAGKVAGKDFGCVNIPGTKGLVVTTDAWGLLGGVDDAHKQAELDFAAVVTDPNVQADFAAAKGSSPLRTDAPKDKLDICSATVLKALENPDGQFQNPHNTASTDWLNSTWDVMFKYWSEPNMTADDAIAQLKDAFDTILG